MAVFAGTPVAALILTGLRLPLSYNFALAWLQPVLSLQDIGLWFLLLYLLKLDENRTLAYATRLIAIISFIATSLDGAADLARLVQSGCWRPGYKGRTARSRPSSPWPRPIRWCLSLLALRKRLDPARWLVAVPRLAGGDDLGGAHCTRSRAAGIRTGLWERRSQRRSSRSTATGSTRRRSRIRCCCWRLSTPCIATYRSLRYGRATLEQEFKSARELQQVLIPETLPSSAGVRDDELVPAGAGGWG